MPLTFVQVKGTKRRRLRVHGDHVHVLGWISEFGRFVLKCNRVGEVVLVLRRIGAEHLSECLLSQVHLVIVLHQADMDHPRLLQGEHQGGHRRRAPEPETLHQPRAELLKHAMIAQFSKLNAPGVGVKPQQNVAESSQQPLGKHPF